MCALIPIPVDVRTEFHQEITPRHGVVTLFGYGANVRVDRGHLIIEDGIGRQRRYGRFPRIGHGLERLVVIGSDGIVSLAALRWLADQKATFLMLDRLGKVLAVTGPVYPSDARLRRAQSLSDNSGTALRIAIELIRQKLIAQERLVREKFQDAVLADTICDQRHALMKAESKEEIRRCEAHAALAYWKAWHELPVIFPQADLRRVPEHWRTFGGRLSPLTKSPRLAVNPPNAILNYLYAMLEAEARLAISELGLDPGIGVLHSDTRTRDSLACDLMEPVRPQVDALVLQWLRTSPLQRKWFFEGRDGNCRLMGEFAAKISETSKMWRQALGPFAEWIAQSLSSSIFRTSQPVPATRLTQNRKRKAKGISIHGFEDSSIRGGNSIPVTSLFRVGKPARLERFDPIAQSRRSETQRRQFATLLGWNPNQKPKWLDEVFFRREIQPRLKNLSVSRIRSLLIVSSSYALRIRNRRCIPHPRHWLSLAQTVGVSRR